MSWTLVETDWFDLEGWEARLEELRADDPSEQRTGLITEIEDHIAWLRLFPDTPEKSPVSSLGA